MGRDGWFRRLRRPRVSAEGVVPIHDSLPKTGLIAEPVRVAALTHSGTDRLEDGSDRVTFLVEIRAADGARCPAIAVEARMEGPHRTRTVSGATDLFGRIRFRMAGPPGVYRCTVTDVAAGGLVWDPGAAPPSATVTVGT